ARAAAISQPALSMQIRELEAAVGVPLVERRARRVEITEAGREVARRATAILKAVTDLQDVGGAYAAGGQGGLAGRLSLGMIPTVAPYLLPTLLGRLVEAAPDLELSVRESQTETLLDDVGRAELDAALVALPAIRDGLVSMPLIGEPFLLLRRRGDGPPLQQREAPAKADPAMLSDQRLLLLEEGHCLRDQALSFCTTAGAATGGDTLSVSSLSTLAQMAEAGMGVTLIPAMAARVEVRSDTLECLEFGRNGPSRVLGLVWRATSPVAERFEAFGRIVGEAARSVLGTSATGLAPSAATDERPAP
ncbi:MAG: hydrogen peroxide-inducible genes activator, partial [Pseudomonadota bacterium]